MRAAGGGPSEQATNSDDGWLAVGIGVGVRLWPFTLLPTPPPFHPSPVVLVPPPQAAPRLLVSFEMALRPSSVEIAFF